MIKSIRLTKTPTKNSSTLLKQIDKVDQSILTPLLESHLLGEGVYGFESITNCDDTENFLVTPSFMRNLIGRESVRDYRYLLNSLSNIHCYHIILDKPSFLPLYVAEPTSLIQQFQLLQSDTNEIYVQFLFSKRSDMWQYGMIDMYKSYMDGNDFPSPLKTGRKVQEKMLNVIMKLGNFDMKRQEIEEISQKILENGYRFELKVVIYEENQEKLHKIELEMEEILKEMDFFNQLGVMKSRNKKQFMSDYLSRRFTDISKNQMISESELICMCSDEIVERESKTIEGVIEEAKQETVSVRNVSNKSMFNLLPLGEKKDREIDQEIVAVLPTALKKAKATKTDRIEIVNVELGATVQLITFKIPDGHVYSDIKGRYEDLKSTLGHESLSIVQGREPNTVTFLIPCSQREIIYLKELIEDEKFINFAKEHALPFICGIDMYNEPLYKDLTEAPHLMVSGATNSGKSVFVNALLITLLLLKSPKELRLYLIDPKQVEFGLYEGLAHVEKVITDMSEAEKLLEQLVVEMEERYAKFAKCKPVAKNIKAFNNQSKEKLPYLICAIDEYNDLRMVYPGVEDHIKRLGQKARAAGIHLILATQRPDKDVMSGVIKTNIPSRISFKLDNSNEYRTVFGTGIPFKNLLGRGDGVVKFVGQAEEFIRFQSPVITLDEVEEENVYKSIREAFGGSVKTSQEEPKVAQIQPIDTLKRIIATTGETRISQLREQMGIRINLVSDLVQQLVTEGWLKKENNKYEIVASEEELAKYKEEAQ